jgi:hypothetical protein
MDHLPAIIRTLRGLGEAHPPLELFVTLLPLSLGWPIAIWFAGGRGTAVASSLLMMLCRSLRMHSAAHSDALPLGWPVASFLGKQDDSGLAA